MDKAADEIFHHSSFGHIKPFFSEITVSSKSLLVWSTEMQSREQPNQ